MNLSQKIARRYLERKDSFEGKISNSPDVLKWRQKRAKFEPFENEHIQNLREEFLKLTRNVSDLETPEQAREFRKILLDWYSRLEDVLEWLRRALRSERELAGGDIPDEEVEKAVDEVKDRQNKLRIKIYDFPTRKLQKYDYNEGELIVPDTWEAVEKNQHEDVEQNIKETWFRSIRRYGRMLWSKLEEVKDRFQEQGADIETRFPEDEIEKIAGFPAKIIGYEDHPDFNHQEKMKAIKSGLKKYRQKAKKTAPILLQKQDEVLLEIDFACKKSFGGMYDPKDQTIKICAELKTEPKRVAKVMAHEMGHHIWRTSLSKDQKEFWKNMIWSSQEPIKIDEILEKWPEGMRQKTFYDRLKKHNTSLYLKLQSLEQQADEFLVSREDFEEYPHDEVEVFPDLPTGYASKNPEEAFNEVLSTLVAYGTRSVPDGPIRWIKKILPNLKLSSNSALI